MKWLFYTFLFFVHSLIHICSQGVALDQSEQSPIMLDLSDHSARVLPEEAFYAKNPLKISVDLQGGDNVLINALCSALEQGNQLKVIKKDYSFCKNKKDLFLFLAEDHVQFYIAFKFFDDQCVWKMYNVFTKSFIIGKAYRMKKDSLIDLQRTILIDIWQTIFGEGKTPFHCFLTFLETARTHEKQLSQIFFTHPLIQGYSKKILTTKHAIIDLGKLPKYEGGEPLLFSLCKNGEVDIVSLDPQGIIKTLIKSDAMAMSPSVNNDGLFYISGGMLYRFYFNKITKKFVSQLLDKANHYVSVCAHPHEKKLLIAKNKKIYEVLYALHDISGEMVVEKAYQISSLGSVMANAAYDGEVIIASEKMRGYYQLVLFDGGAKIILTHSDYHKQDPTISPCGTYIAYIAQEADGNRYVEMMNRFTGIVFRVTQHSGEYRFPVWVVR
jgi:hypothetical protein